MNGKKLLILGATAETSSLVIRAEQLGVETYVVDPYPDAPAKKYASHPIDLDGFDVDGISDLVISEKTDGVLLGCADILARPYFRVCEKTNKYCYLNERVLDTFNNKKGLKEMLKKYDLPVIPEYSEDEVLDPCFDAFPVYVKPVDNNSAKGMSRVHSAKEYEAAKEKALQFSKSGSILIEKDMYGADDIQISCIIEDGVLKLFFIADRFSSSSQYGVGSVTQCLIGPSQYADLYFTAIHDKLAKMVSDLNFKNGFLVIQGFADDDRILFYDPCLRFINGTQEYYFLSKVYDVELPDCFINFAIFGTFGRSIGSSINWDYEGKHICNLAFSSKPGRIGLITGIEEARKDPHVINITLKHSPGSVIDKVGTLQQNFCRMHIVTDTGEEMLSCIKNLQKTVRVFDDNGNDMTLEGMDPVIWYKQYCVGRNKV